MDEDNAAAEEKSSSDVESRLQKLEQQLIQTQKELDSERKASAGKDKKITELSSEKKDLQKATLSKDELLRLREQELAEQQAEWEKQREIEKMELEKLRVANLRREVLRKIENFPSFLEDRVMGDSPEEIEADARTLMNRWVKDRGLVQNAGKLGSKPVSGDGKQVSITAQDIREMTAEQKRHWAETATDEEYMALSIEAQT